MKHLIGIIMVVFGLFMFWDGIATAHEKREVAAKYRLVVGFLKEPAFSGEMNGLDLRVLEADQKPVEGLEKTLKARVIDPFSDKFKILELKTRYKDPGAYAGYFLPTRSGKYVFLIEGSINGEVISERFESGPGRFHDIEDSSSFRFPN